MLKIGINVTFTPSGGSYTQVIHMLNFLSKENNTKLIIFSKKNNRTLIKHIDRTVHLVIESRLSSISAFTRVLWEQLLLPFYLFKYKVDLLFCPGDMSPIFTSVKKVQWIGTIGPFWDKIYDYDIGLLKRIKYPVNKFLMYKSAEYADHIIFESNYSRDYFLDRYNIDKEKTTVINIGKDELLLNNKGADSSLNKKYNPFVLCVSHLYPYKNIPRMIECFYRANENIRHSTKLLIAGSFILEKYTNSIRSIINDLNYNDNVLLLGMVNKKKLRYLYENCEFMIFPSPCENFAYTLVEAMSLGTPIVCSNTTAMPDTCLEAAIYFNPFDKDDMTNKISLMLDNKILQKQYSKKSIARANSLPTYQEVTKRTIGICYKTIGLDKKAY
jgi:glycosyltransferase involved in cell wall biosynthesis